MSGLRVSTLRGETPGTSPSLPDGAVVTGVITSTSFSGNLTGNVTGNIAGATGSFTGNVSVGGTLTYEDVTNIDSVGIITARSDISIADKIIHTGDTNTAIRFPAVDTFTVETAGSERLRVLSDATIATGGLSATPGTVAAGSIVNANANAGFFTNGYDGKFGTASNHPVYIQVNGSSKLTIATSGNLTSTGTISDSLGQVRRLPTNTQSGNYTLVASDLGKMVVRTGGNITIADIGTAAAGDMITIMNNAASDMTIISSSFTLYNTADASTTSPKTLAARGMATLVFIATNVAYISGGGLS